MKETIQDKDRFPLQFVDDFIPVFLFFFSSRRRHTSWTGDWSSDVCSSDLDGSLFPIAEQDRGRWDAQAIAEGTALISQALASAPIGPYQLQAAIAAVHDEAPRAEDTDWPHILGL